MSTWRVIFILFFGLTKRLPKHGMFHVLMANRRRPSSLRTVAQSHTCPLCLPRRSCRHNSRAPYRLMANTSQRRRPVYLRKSYTQRLDVRAPWQLTSAHDVHYMTAGNRGSHRQVARVICCQRAMACYRRDDLILMVRRGSDALCRKLTSAGAKIDALLAQQSRQPRFREYRVK